MGLGKTAQAISYMHTLTTSPIGVKPQLLQQHQQFVSAASSASASSSSAPPSPSRTVTSPSSFSSSSSSSTFALPGTTRVPLSIHGLHGASIDASVLAHRRGPFLVVAPLSTLGHWAREIETWTVGSGTATKSHLLPHRSPYNARSSSSSVAAASSSSSSSSSGAAGGHTYASSAAAAPLNVVTYHGSAPSRQAVREHEFYFTDPATGVQLRPALHGPPDSVTSHVNAAAAELYGPPSSPSAAAAAPSQPRLYQAYKFDVLITTYEMVMSDAQHLGGIPWAAIIVDEAHRLKNTTSKLATELIRWKRDHVLLLTGTPIQNNIEELWALLHFTAPRVFTLDQVVIPGLPNTGYKRQTKEDREKARLAEEAALEAAAGEGSASASSSSSSSAAAAAVPAAGSAASSMQPRSFNKSVFMSRFGALSSAEQVATLHGILRPYLLRRLKEDVHTRLPPKQETIIEVEMTTIQKQYYRAIYERNTGFLMASAAAAGGSGKASAAQTLPSLMNVVMELRKACNHPYQLRGVEDVMVARAIAAATSSAAAEGRPVAAAEIAASVNEQFVSVSGKFVLLDKLLPKLRSGGHRVLIFSQMVKTLDLLADYAAYRRYPAERLDGRIRGPERQAAIDKFCDPSQDAFLMLLSTRAGGLGINLTAADTVIIFDSDWNPQNDLQVG